jgi:hypothetical protein
MSDNEEPTEAELELAARVLRRKMTMVANAKYRRRRVAGPSHVASFSEAVDRINAGDSVRDLMSDASALPIVTESERLATAIHLTNWARGLTHPGRIAHPQRYLGLVRKYFCFDQDAVTIWYGGPRQLFGGDIVAFRPKWWPADLAAARAVAPLLRPGVLLSATGEPLSDFPCPMTLDILLKVVFSHEHRVATKLKSMLRDSEDGWRRGFFAKIGTVRVGSSIHAEIQIGDSRPQHADANAAFWDGMSAKMLDALWQALRDTMTASFDSSVTEADGSVSAAADHEPHVQMYAHTNTVRFEHSAEACVNLNKGLIYRIDRPAIFFRLLNLHCMRAGLCLSIALVNYGHKYLDSQTSQQFCVDEMDGNDVPRAEMLPAYHAIQGFVQKSWDEVGWKQCATALFEALGGDEIRIGSSFGMYIHGLMPKDQVPAGQSPWLMAMPPADRLDGVKSTESRPFALPFYHATSCTVASPANRAKQISLRFRHAVGDRHERLVPVSSANGDWRATELQGYHPGSQMWRKKLHMIVFARLENPHESEANLLRAIAELAEYQEYDSQRPFDEVRPLMCTKRFEVTVETVLSSTSSIESVQLAIVNALENFVYCCAELPSVHFYLGADDMIRHSRMKISNLVTMSHTLNVAARMQWCPSEGRTAFVREVLAPQIVGSRSLNFSYC